MRNLFLLLFVTVANVLIAQNKNEHQNIELQNDSNEVKHGLKDMNVFHRQLRLAPEQILLPKNTETDFKSSEAYTSSKDSVFVEKKVQQKPANVKKKIDRRNVELKIGGGAELAYPILFVHGWMGTDQSWGPFTNWLSNNSDLGAPILMGYCLNNDAAFSYSEVSSDISEELLWINSIPSANLYYLTFNCDPFGDCYYGGNDFYESNQSAVFKQGRAISLAIEEILSVTGKEKIILIGHSMGGLAVREYHQNPAHWFDNQSNVAKLVTFGTPNWGSDHEPAGGWLNFAGTIYNGAMATSEAVRDLRSSYDIFGEFQHQGIFLWGDGYESQDVMLDNLLEDWNNVDVNCNGSEGNFISSSNALNGRPFDGLIEYASVWHVDDDIVDYDALNYGYLPFNSVAWNRGGEDLCSCLDAANVGINICETWSVNTNGGFPSYGHSEMLSENNTTLRSLDEADCYQQAYEVRPQTLYEGFITSQGEGSPYDDDWDDYFFSVNEPSILTVDIVYTSSANPINLFVVDSDGDGTCNINGYFDYALDISQGEQLIVELPPGMHYLEFSGFETSGFGRYQYIFNLEPIISGCNDPLACNFTPNVNLPEPSICTYPGCTDPTACDFDPAAGCNGTCTYPDELFLDCLGNCINDSNSNGFCDEEEGCLDAGACNYNSDYLFDDGSCEYETCAGCTDPLANNYDPEASIEDGSCDFDCILADLSYEVIGCGDNSGFFFVEIGVENLGTAAPYNAVNTQNNDIITINELGSSILGPFESSDPVAITLISSSLDNCLGTSPILSCPILSIDEDAEFLFSIYPNPAKDICTLDLGIFWINAQAKLLDAQGKQVMELTIDSQQTELNLSALEAGNYQVVLQKGSKRILHRLVVQ